MKAALWLGAAVLALGALSYVKYNRLKDDLAVERRGVVTAWAGVADALDRRAELVPALAGSARRRVPRETAVYQELESARAALAAAASPAARIEASNRLSAAFGRLLILTETNPELRADRTFQHLEEDLGLRDNAIAVERRKYNEALQKYNTSIGLFPNNIVASLSGFAHDDAYFRTGPATGSASKVQF